MNAVVLVGGEGTRLRPLTETTPKPLIPLMDRASLDFVLDHLASHGVHEAILSSPYLEETFGPFVASRSGDPRITWITEEEPLGTGGAIVNALSRLGSGEPFFALNGDILTDLDLTTMLAFHRERGATATIALHRVDDARAFGLVMRDQESRVTEFREKPGEQAPGDINAGTYVLDPAALSGYTAGESLSIEREIFPVMIASGKPLFGFASDAYWLDLGTPEMYLQAHEDMLQGKVHGASYPAPLILEGAEVDLRAHLGLWVVVGPDARVGPDAEVEDSVLHAGARVLAGARVRDSILGANSEVGEGATLTGCVVGAGARVRAGASLDSERVPSSTEA